MNDAIVISHDRRGALASTERISTANAIALWLAGFASSNTRRAYEREISRFANFMRLPTEAAIDGFLAAHDHQAHTLTDAYRATMQARGCAPSTINRAMAALNSLVRSARRHGLTELRLEARSVKSQKYRDTSGPGTAGIQKMVDVSRRRRSQWMARRDEAIVRLLFALGLRRAELIECDLKHLDIGAGTLSVMGKGEQERRRLSVPPAALAAVQAWIAERGMAHGPLILSADTRSRMSGSGLYHVVTTVARSAGIICRPHGIRHAAITAVLDATNGDMRKAQAFGRHASASTTVAYDDNRQDLGGSAARLLDALVD